MQALGQKKDEELKKRSFVRGLGAGPSTRGLRFKSLSRQMPSPFFSRRSWIWRFPPWNENSWRMTSAVNYAPYPETETLNGWTCQSPSTTGMLPSPYPPPCIVDLNPMGHLTGGHIAGENISLLEVPLTSTFSCGLLHVWQSLAHHLQCCGLSEGHQSPLFQTLPSDISQTESLGPIHPLSADYPLW